MAARTNGNGLAKAEAVKSFDDLSKADFGTKAAWASAAVWSPNPKNPPFYADLPTKNGEVLPDVLAKWAANAPLAMVDQYIPNHAPIKRSPWTPAIWTNPSRPQSDRWLKR